MPEPQHLAVRLIMEYPDITIFEVVEKSGSSFERVLDEIGYHTLHPSFKPLIYNGTLKLHHIVGLSRLKDVEQQAIFWDHYSKIDPEGFHDRIRAIVNWNRAEKFGRDYGSDPTVLRDVGLLSQEEAEKIINRFYEAYPKLREMLRGKGFD